LASLLIIEAGEQQNRKLIAALDEKWRKKIKAEYLERLVDGKTMEQATPIIIKTYQSKLRRIEQTNDVDILEIILNSLTHLYDPHTSYLAPRMAKNFNLNMKLSLVGIGLIVQSHDDLVRISRIVKGGPGEIAGFQPNDIVLAIAQAQGEFVDIEGMRLDEVVELMRGAKGSLVRLKIKRADAIKIVPAIRGDVRLEEQSARKEVVTADKEGNRVTIGIIKIPSMYIDFDAVRRGKTDYKSSTRDVKVLLEELKSQQVSGIILDLRNNGGGSLEESTGIPSLFLAGGPIIQFQDASGRIQRKTDSPHEPLYDGPLVVLVNEMTASGAEIVAAALQDYGRAVIVGTPTYGMGTVQLLARLRKGQLKLTQSKFYRINGDSIQLKGILPDIHLPPSIFHVGEIALPNALKTDSIIKAKYEVSPLTLNDIEILQQKGKERNEGDTLCRSIAELSMYLEKIASDTQLELNIDERRNEIAKRNATLDKIIHPIRIHYNITAASSDINTAAIFDEFYQQEAVEVLTDLINLKK